MPSFKKTTEIISVILIILSLSACSLRTIKEQSTRFDKLAKISGKVSATYKTDSPIVVAVLTFDDAKIDIIKQKLVDGNGNYQFNLLPGEYLVGAYIDSNNNQVRDQYESAAMHNELDERFTKINLSENQEFTLPLLEISKDQNIGTTQKVAYSRSKVRKNIGRVISLDDAMFSKENTTMGLWRPFDFSKKIGGGLMFLQEYDKSKTPVLFVHGISGSPTEFKAVIEQLDRNKFQPWILYYPSGVPLAIISDYMLSSLIKLQSQYDFEHFQLVSHSMGGLITRTFLREHEKANTNFNVSLYVTINSPLYGMDSAAIGVKSSPIVIASWRDLATGSDYIKAAHQWKIPKTLPYHLFFSYLAGEDGDGVVPLRSQLSLSLQEEATKIYGSQASHAGILAKPDFIQRLIKIMLSPNL
ncbi:hypothetical protein CXF85_10290 [Colwellia sp. 75C3]|uniref:lipase family alpha/beta hydrolase n=1 Tax=Colwellia sp. 75C3 TaxID=888425 RepID=UPI000C340717|nr:alpha/beta hydrolase [Colwellia sp. 75C3]PKG83876.1 hypothetical protein CXF85_10290 [Colwellia sp. 75C3]